MCVTVRGGGGGGGALKCYIIIHIITNIILFSKQFQEYIRETTTYSEKQIIANLH